MTRSVSSRDRDVLEFIVNFIAEQGFPPTVREIGEGVGMSSPSTVHGHVEALCEAGCIERTFNGSPRAIRVLKQAS